jgi:hypothetical protein
LAWFFRFWLGFFGLARFFRFGSGLAQFWLGLARFFSGFLSVSVRFGFLVIKPKPNRTGWFFQKFNRFFFWFGFFGYCFSDFLGLIGFPVFLLTPTCKIKMLLVKYIYKKELIKKWM